MIQVNGPRDAIQPKPAPIPELEGKNIRRSRDFKDHGVDARAMDYPGWDREMVMLLSWKNIDEVFSREWSRTACCGVKGRSHFVGVHAVFEAEID